MQIPILLFAIVAVACKPTVPGAGGTPLPTVTRSERINEPLPDFLVSVWPAPTEIVGISEFREGLDQPRTFTAPGDGKRSICTYLNVRNIIQPGDYFPLEDGGDPIPGRTNLWVNGQGVEMYKEYMTLPTGAYSFDEQGTIVAEATGPIIFCWPIEAEVGEHIVAITIAQTSGNILEYGWSFRIVADG